ncbi:MAG TPA: hypothetical protein VEA15_06410 [Caulobacteraceae bacterium]|nr:hypothetical protein [Caulobacteraceae bacterium]
MSDDNPNIVSLAERRRREEARRKAEAAAAAASSRQAASRRKLAEHGPAPARLGRSVGRVLSWVVWLTLLGAIALILWSRLGGTAAGPAG